VLYVALLAIFLWAVGVIFGKKAVAWLVLVTVAVVVVFFLIILFVVLTKR
jgi:hypothetical protein